MLRKLKELYAKYERWLMPGALILGFITDALTFRLISFDFAVFGLVVYLFITGLGIIIIQLYEDGLLRGKFFDYARLASPLILQYTFGSLFSSFVIFYSFSRSILASWPFLLTLVFLMIANEIFKKYITRPDIQFPAYFFAVFALTNLAVPYFIRDIGPKIFVASGLLSVAIIALFIKTLYDHSLRVKKTIKAIIISCAAIFIAMNVFYFTNLIPPIPLSLRDIGLFYNIERVPPNKYLFTDRLHGFFEKFTLAEKFYIYDSTEAYAFSSVFAPAEINLVIIHEWQYHNPELGWITKNKVSFPIIGGREEGFRGFSKTTQLQPGNWRINITTTSGQPIGRKIFTVIQTQEPLSLYNVIK